MYPLVDFGIEEATIRDWAKDVPLFNDYYKYNRRCGCMYCPLASMQNMAYLLKYYPDHYEACMRMAKATELAVEQKTGKPTSMWHGTAKYNTDYRDKRVREVYLPKLEAQIEENERRKRDAAID